MNLDHARDPKRRALVVDDEPDIVQLLELALGGAGFDTAAASGGEAALRLVREQAPDLLLLDWMLPDLPGPEVCRVLKRDPRTRAIPIIVVTARATERDRVEAFELGVDDYVTKPFSVRELILRCEAVLRKADVQRKASPHLRCGPIEIDTAGWRCSIDGAPVELTALEFRLLADLMQSAGRVRSNRDLLRSVWELLGPVETQTVKTHVNRLRRKLQHASAWLQTVRGVGYRFAPPA